MAPGGALMAPMAHRYIWSKGMQSGAQCSILVHNEENNQGYWYHVGGAMCKGEGGDPRGPFLKKI